MRPGAQNVGNNIIDCEPDRKSPNFEVSIRCKDSISAAMRLICHRASCPVRGDPTKAGQGHIALFWAVQMLGLHSDHRSKLQSQGRETSGDRRTFLGGPCGEKRGARNRRHTRELAKGLAWPGDSNAGEGHMSIPAAASANGGALVDVVWPVKAFLARWVGSHRASHENGIGFSAPRIRSPVPKPVAQCEPKREKVLPACSLLDCTACTTSENIFVQVLTVTSKLSSRREQEDNLPPNETEAASASGTLP